MKANLHTHTTWCDGVNTPEEMIVAAIERRFDVLGFSSHSDMLEDPAAYRAEIYALKAKYAGRLEVRCGVEAEYSPLFHRDGYEYVIGAVHYVRAEDGARVAVDMSPESLREGIAAHFGGSAERFIKAYFAAEREMLKAFDFDIMAHPDLIRKFNAKAPYFDEGAAWYREEVARLAQAIADSGKIVEINTGAISRGWLDDAYPAKEFRELLTTLGVKFIVSSDAHSADALDCEFERFTPLTSRA